MFMHSDLQRGSGGNRGARLAKYRESGISFAPMLNQHTVMFANYPLEERVEQDEPVPHLYWLASQMRRLPSTSVDR